MDDFTQWETETATPENNDSIRMLAIIGMLQATGKVTPGRIRQLTSTYLDCPSGYWRDRTLFVLENTLALWEDDAPHEGS